MADKTTATTADKVADEESTDLQVAGKIDPGTWDKCVMRAFMEGRIKTNSGIVAAALKEYAAK